MSKHGKYLKGRLEELEDLLKEAYNSVHTEFYNIDKIKVEIHRIKVSLENEWEKNEFKEWYNKL